MNFDFECFESYRAITSDFLLLKPCIALASLAIFKHGRRWPPLTNHYWRAKRHSWQLFTTIKPLDTRHRPILDLSAAQILPMAWTHFYLIMMIDHLIPNSTVNYNWFLASTASFLSLDVFDATYKWVLLFFFWQCLIQKGTQIKGVIKVTLRDRFYFVAIRG